MMENWRATVLLLAALTITSFWEVKVHQALFFIGPKITALQPVESSDDKNS